MKQAPDAIYIITRQPARAEELKRAIVLRGFDEILCVPVEKAATVLKIDPPVLVILDLDGENEKVLQLLEILPDGVKSMVLAEAYEESLFLACHDQGTRDFMVKPVAEAYLVSRVIHSLQENRREQLLTQKDRTLVEMGVLSAASGVLTTSYLFKLLQRYADQASGPNAQSLTLLILQLEGYQSPLPPVAQAVVMRKVGGILKESARGLDEVGEYFMDKFAVILPQTGRRGGKALANRLIERLHGLTFKGPESDILLSLRVGIAEYAGCRHYEDLVHRALDDLNGVKGGGAVESANSPLHPV